jgi:AAA15 family ATPase/GTPase
MEETSLSMIATSDKDHREFNVIPAEHDDLLKNVLIYGANASGKSNLIHAMQFMMKMIVSSIDVQTEHIKTCRPFSFRADKVSHPTKFEISFLLDHVVYDYGFDILQNRISREYLYKKAKRRTLVFERTAPGYESIKLTPDMEDVEPMKKNVRGDVLFLSWAAYANNALAMKIIDWISNSFIIFGEGNRAEPDKNIVSEFTKSFVRKADGDILDMEFQSDGILVSSHKEYSKDWKTSQTVWAKFAGLSSDGTKRMFDLSHTFAKALEYSAVIVIDEIDLHLHPALVRHLISLINSIEHNPNHAQLICTTHDVMLLDVDIRRDQIWFVEKDEHSVSSLYSLSDFKDVRKNSDILKRYLLGVYGAVPDLNRGGGNE